MHSWVVGLGLEGSVVCRLLLTLQLECGTCLSSLTYFKFFSTDGIVCVFSHLSTGNYLIATVWYTNTVVLEVTFLRPL